MRKKSRMNMQCKLINNNKSKIVFIPEEFAVRGKMVSIFDKNKGYGTWVDGWFIQDVGLSMPFDTVRERNFKYIRDKDIREESSIERTKNA